ncbi:MAG: hypothetical protein Q8K78_00715 [Planctomycetaceae bacterium]|nr:hypothetical protein [Planctomycetaceae bacterium]
MATPDFAYSLNPRVTTSPTVKTQPRKFVLPGQAIRWGIAALLATVVALPMAVTFDGRFPVENLSVEMTNRIRNNRHDAVAWAKERSNRWESLYRTTVACLTGFGATLGGIAALLGVVSPAPMSARLRWLMAGIVLGAVAAALGGYLEAGLLIKIEKITLDPMLRAMLGHAVAWMVVGAGVAIAATLSVPAWLAKKVAIGRAMVGAIGAAVLYSPLAAILFQLERSDLPIPEGSLNKLLFLGLAGLLICGRLGSVPSPSIVPSGNVNETSLSPLPEGSMGTA